MKGYLAASIVWVLVLLSPLVYAAPPTAAVGAEIPNNGSRVYTTMLSGRYSTADCDPPQANSLITVFQLMDSVLSSAIADAKLGYNSKHGYKAFFKSKVTFWSENKAREMLKWVLDQRRISGLTPDKREATLPTIVCLKHSTQRRYGLPLDVWGYCNEKYRGTASIYVQGTRYIVLCNAFWTLPKSPGGVSIGERCPEVQDNAFRKGESLVDFQIYRIIHDAIHFYLGQKALTLESQPKEAMQLNECVALQARDSIHDPANFVGYVAMVHQGCNEAPDPSLPPWNTDNIKEDKGDGNLVDEENVASNWTHDVNTFDSPSPIAVS